MGLKIKGISFKQNNGFDLSYDNQLLLERVGRIIMTYQTERVNNPDFGSLLETFLFYKGSILKQHVETSLKNTIEKYEPRVRVISANVVYNKEEANVYITVQRKDTLEVLTFEQQVAL